MAKMKAEETLKAQIEALRAENEALRAKKATAQKLSLKVSGKGALSVYGMGRFPVTLYAEQWEKLLAHVEEIKAFLKTNDKHLTRKSDGDVE